MIITTNKPSNMPLSVLDGRPSGIHPNSTYNFKHKEKMSNISIRLSDPKAMPLRAHYNDAGADLRSVHPSFIIYPGEQQLVDTGVAVKIPTGYVGYVFNRSSQGRLGIQIPHSVGVIDSQYRGNIKVLLKNNGDDPHEIHQYTTRIAQLVISPVVLAVFVPETCTDAEWNDTARGTGGFGSTG